MEEILKKLKEHRDEHRRKILFEGENDFDRGVYCGIDLAVEELSKNTYSWDLLKKLNQAEVSNSEAAFKSGWLKADDYPCDKEIRLKKALEEWKLLNDC